jgi:quinoprotein glucose dehydrogenase
MSFIRNLLHTHLLLAATVACTFPASKVVIAEDAVAAGTGVVEGRTVEGGTVDQSWPQYRGDIGGKGFSPLQQINTESVSDLKLAWEYKTGDLEKYGELLKTKSALQVTPIVLPQDAGGSMLICTPFSEVIALDPETGEQRWRFNPDVDVMGNYRAAKCRGVSWWRDDTMAEGELCRDRVISATHDRRIIALDTRTGKACPDFGDAGEAKLYNPQQGYKLGDIATSSAPLVANQRIVVGSAVVDFQKTKAPMGTVEGFDVKTGTKVWTYELIPDADSNDAEALASWPADAREVTGAANAWAPMSADVERDLVFVPTGSPAVDFYGVKRPGNNLNANSVLALRISTGELVWRYQFVHHDLWDYDTPAQPLLVDLPIEGETIPALVQVTKQGFVFVLNRETGKPVFPVDEIPVSQQASEGEWLSPTQPMPRYPKPIMQGGLTPDDAWGFTPWDKGACRDKLADMFSDGLFTPLQIDRWTALMPGSLGGANWGGAVYWPENNTIYLNVNTAAFRARLVKTDAAVASGHAPKNGETMRVSMQGTPYTLENEALTSPLGPPCVKPPWGKLMAINLTTAEHSWESALGSIHEMGPFPIPFQINWGTPNLGGALVTQGGLVFIGATMDRLFRAFDAKTGKVLWDHKLPADAVASPMTYSVNGKQYVAIAAGGHHMFGRDMADSIMVFALK